MEATDIGLPQVEDPKETVTETTTKPSKSRNLIYSLLAAIGLVAVVPPLTQQSHIDQATKPEAPITASPTIPGTEPTPTAIPEQPPTVAEVKATIEAHAAAGQTIFPPLPTKP
jgi:hypothetical protein